MTLCSVEILPERGRLARRLAGELRARRPRSGFHRRDFDRAIALQFGCRVMTKPLSHAGYLSARKKLANMESRLTALRARTDLDPPHRSAVERSYLDMMRQYLRDVQLYEATHPTSTTAPET